MKLYYFPPSPNTRKAHAVAIHLGLSIELRLVNLVNGILTLADFAVASDLTYAVPRRFPLENYPHIQAWYSQIEQLPAWQQTAPRG
jgi:glutathione S-transferase